MNEDVHRFGYITNAAQRTVMKYFEKN